MLEDEDNEAQEIGPGSSLNESKLHEPSVDTIKLLPDRCHYTLLKSNLVEKLSMDYVLVNHPFPTLEGELLIY